MRIGKISPSVSIFARDKQHKQQPKTNKKATNKNNTQHTKLDHDQIPSKLELNRPRVKQPNAPQFIFSNTWQPHNHYNTIDQLAMSQYIIQNNQIRKKLSRRKPSFRSSPRISTPHEVEYVIERSHAHMKIIQSTHRTLLEGALCTAELTLRSAGAVMGHQALLWGAEDVVHKYLLWQCM